MQPKLLVLLGLALSAGAFRVQAQGTVRFGNYIPGEIDAPVLATDGVSKAEASRTTQYIAQLYYSGSTSNRLEQVVGYLLPLGSGTNAGYFGPQVVRIPFIAPGAKAFCQVRVWVNGHGPTYEASVANLSDHGESEVIEVTLGPERYSSQTEVPIMKGLKSIRLQAAIPGEINFKNLIQGILDAPVFDLDGATLLSGPAYLAQLYALAIENPIDAVEVGQPFPFGTGANAGYWDAVGNSIVVLTNVAAGHMARVHVAVWESAKGATYQEAIRASSKRGESVPLEIKAGGGGAPAANLTGLASFSLGGAVFGTVNLSNFVPGLLDAPATYFDSNLLKQVPFAGPNYVAQLFAGPGDLSTMNLSVLSPVTGENPRFPPVSNPMPFGTADKAGYWETTGDGTVTIPNVQAGDYAILQVRIWDKSKAATYADAVTAGLHGGSQFFKVRTGGVGTPPNSPALLTPLARMYYSLGGAHFVKVDFRNHIPGVLDNPVLAVDGSRLAGSAYVAQLYAGFAPLGNSYFQPIGPPAPFGTGAQAGYWQPGTNSIRVIEIKAGCCADVQVRIWDSTKGASYEEATGGARKVSRNQGYSGGTTRVNFLDQIGTISMRTLEFPAISATHRAEIYDLDRLTLLSGPGYSVQVYVGASTQQSPYPDPSRYPTNFVAVGSVYPVGTGARRGHSEMPPGTLMEIPFLKPGQLAYACLRVWESAKGATYEDAVRNGGKHGESDFRYKYFVANRLEESPVPLDFDYSESSVRLIGVTKKLTVPPGLSLIGNPLANGPNYIFDVLRQAPDGTAVYLFNNDTHYYDAILRDFGAWLPFSARFKTGQAAFISIPGTNALELTFSGEEAPPIKIASRPSRTEFYAVGGSSAQPSKVEDWLSFPLLNGDRAYRFGSAQWSTTQYDGSTWSPFDPEVKQGEAIFLRLMPRP